MSGGGTARVSQSVAGRLATGEEVIECRLANGRGTEAAILTLGATLRSCIVADARGDPADVVLGFDSVNEYLRGNHCFGATVGRYANRIANGRFRLGAQAVAGEPGRRSGLSGGTEGRTSPTL